MSYTCRIPGEPVGKGRPRVTSSGHAYTPPRTRAWEAAAALQLRLALRPLPSSAPLRVEVTAAHPAPQRRADLEGRPAMGGGRRPDLDNVAKAVLDALQLSGVIPDDRQVVQVSARSVYGPPGVGWVEVSVTALDGAQMEEEQMSDDGAQTPSNMWRASQAAQLLNHAAMEGAPRVAFAFLCYATGLHWRRADGPRASFSGEVRLAAQTPRGRLTLNQGGANGEWTLRLWPEGARGVPPVLWSAPPPLFAQGAAALLEAVRGVMEG